ncbi:hypothetical protein F5X96DRAFT_109295 [Biscogniauxia mediterranea]|nr:hypothetical protein F5X96DRAFT_109295 [Biscogniauxia mediterranea]
MTFFLGFTRPSLGESMLPDTCPGPRENRLDDLQSEQAVSSLLTMMRDDDPLSLPDPRPPTPGPQPRPPPNPPQPPEPTPPPSPHYSVPLSNGISQEPGSSPIKPLACPYPPRPPTPTPGPNRPGPVGPRPDVPTPPPSPHRHHGATAILSLRKPVQKLIDEDMLLVLQSGEEEAGSRSQRRRAKQPRKPLAGPTAPGMKGNKKPPKLVVPSEAKGYAVRFEGQHEMSLLYASAAAAAGSNVQGQEPEGSSLLQGTRPIRSVMVILAARFLSSHGSLKMMSNLL